MLARAAKAVSGFLSRSGCAARLPLLAAMAGAAWAQFAWLWAWALGVTGPGELVGTLFVVWHFALVVASVIAVIDESEVSTSAERRWVTSKVPLVLWGGLTRGDRVTVWMALLWILLWPAELLACLWVALWWLGAGAGAVLDLTMSLDKLVARESRLTSGCLPGGAAAPEPGPMVPAESFLGTLHANVDNPALDDRAFREFVRDSLPIVVYPRPGQRGSEDERCSLLAPWLFQPPLPDSYAGPPAAK